MVPAFRVIAPDVEPVLGPAFARPIDRKRRRIVLGQLRDHPRHLGARVPQQLDQDARTEPARGRHPLRVQLIEKLHEVAVAVDRPAGLEAMPVAADREPSEIDLHQMRGHVAHSPGRRHCRPLPIGRIEPFEQLDELLVKRREQMRRVERRQRLHAIDACLRYSLVHFVRAARTTRFITKNTRAHEVSLIKKKLRDLRADFVPS